MLSVHGGEGEKDREFGGMGGKGGDHKFFFGASPLIFLGITSEKREDHKG